MGCEPLVFIFLSLVFTVTCHSSSNDPLGWPFNFIQSWMRRTETTEKTMKSFGALENLVSRVDPSKNEIPAIYSSLRDSSEELDSIGYSQLFQLASFRTDCACQIGTLTACVTQCTSVESRCGRTCLHITEYTVTRVLPSQRHSNESEDDYVISTYLTTATKGCDVMTRACTISTAVTGAAIAAAVGVAVAVAVGASVNGQQMSNVQQQQERQVNQDVKQFLSSGGLFNFQIPRNDQLCPVGGRDLPDGGCGDNLVAFPDGKCYPVLRRGPCDDSFQWVTVDPNTLTVFNVVISLYKLFHI